MGLGETRAILSLADVSAALQIAWGLASPVGIPTQFPGTPLDATRLACWFEFWITQVAEPPQRLQSPSLLRLLIDVHCYSRRSEKRHIFEMADSVRTGLAQQLFALPGIDVTSPAKGTLRIHESTLRDLTRETTTEPRLPLQHVVVVLNGHAEQFNATR